MSRRPDSLRIATRSTSKLSADAIVAAAIAVADLDGLDAVSMRGLGEALHVNPMSLYHHVRDKATLVNAMSDAVLGQIEPEPLAPARPAAWTDELRALILGARRMMLAHPWAPEALAARSSPSPVALRHIDRFLGILRRGGCSVTLRHHAAHALGSLVFGFAQGVYSDAPDVRADPVVLAQQFAVWAATMPDVVELGRAATHGGALGGCDDDAEFAFSVDLVLDGLERWRQAEGAEQTRP